MKKSLNDLIEDSYQTNPDVDEGSEAVGVLIASHNGPKGCYVSRFIQKNEGEIDVKRIHILRVMLREIIIQYGDIFDAKNIEQIISSSCAIMSDVDSFIREKLNKISITK